MTGKRYRGLLAAALILCGAASARGQGQPSDIMRTLSVDVGRRGGENVLYKNGVRLGKRQAKLLFELSPRARRLLGKAYRHRAEAHTLYGVGGGITAPGVGLACDDVHLGASLGLAALGVGIAATGIPLIRSYNAKSSAAAGIYNRAVFHQAVPRRPAAQLKVGVTGTAGLGLALVF